MTDYCIRICKKCNKLYTGTISEECPTCGWKSSPSTNVNFKGPNDIDDLMVPVIKKLLDKGYHTDSCCSSHLRTFQDNSIGISRKPYISFEPFKVDISPLDFPDIDNKVALREFADNLMSQIKNHKTHFMVRNNYSIIGKLFTAYEAGEGMTIHLSNYTVLKYDWIIDLMYDIFRYGTDWYLGCSLNINIDKFPFDVGFKKLNIYSYYSDLCNILGMIEKDINDYIIMRSEDSSDVAQYGEIIDSSDKMIVTCFSLEPGSTLRVFNTGDQKTYDVVIE